MTHTLAVAPVSCEWADESAVQVNEADVETQEGYPLYKRGLWVTPCIPNINDERDPPVMKHNLSTQFSKHEVLGDDHVGIRDRTRRHG